MPDYDVLYPGRFLKKNTLEAPKVVRIVSISTSELENDKGQKEDKATLRYRDAEGEKEMTWPKANSLLCSHVFGTRDYTQWIGHLITIWNDPQVVFAGKKVGGIRVLGSPEMKTAVKVEIKMPRSKRKEIHNLVPTDNKGRALTSKTMPAPAPSTDEPPPVDETDEIPTDDEDSSEESAA